MSRAGDVDAVFLQPLPVDPELVAMAQVADLDLPADVGPARRPHPRGRREELLEFGPRLGVVDFDGRLQQRDARVLARAGGGRLARADRASPRPPATARTSSRSSSLQQEGPVRRAALDRDRALGQRALQPAERLLARVPDGRQLGEHRAELRRDDVALGDAGVDAQARARSAAGTSRPRPATAEKPESTFSAFSRTSMAWPVVVGGCPSSRPPRATCERQLHEVDAGRVLGDRVLDLEPRVDLHEVEPAGRRVEQELDRRRRPGSRRPGTAGGPRP